ncbi:MAG: hypothetical protein HZA58_06405 [Acidimicrobiia bacterium]|nr:hypothetical protein [Acidimicrobiia bacterium]
MDAVDAADLGGHRKPGTWKLPLVAAVLAVGALLLAVVSSLAIEQIRTTYSWGIPDASREDPEWRPVPATGGFTPLLFAAPPFLWDVRWSCGMAPSGGEPFEVFGSIVHDEFGPGLRVTLLDAMFEMVVGGAVVTQAPAQPDAEPGCEYRFTLDDDGAWSLLEGERVLDAGSIGDSPRLTGFGSDLAGADTSGSVGVVVTTQRHGSTASTAVRLMQVGAAVLGVMAVGCLVLWWRREDRGSPAATREG